MVTKFRTSERAVSPVANLCVQPSEAGSKSRSQKYELRPLCDADEDRWNEFVRRSPQGTLFHTKLWLGAVDGEYRLFGCFRRDELRGGFAIGITDRRSAVHPTPALTPYLGLVLPRPESRYVTELSSNKRITAEFAGFLKTEFNSIELRCPPEVVDLQPFIWEGYRCGVRYTYRLSVKDLNVALEGMEKGRRYDMTSARRDGIVAEAGSFEDVMSLSERTFSRQGLPQSFQMAAVRYHSALQKAERCQAFVARDKHGAAVAAVWIVWDEKRAYNLVSGYDHLAGANNAAALVLWRAIQFTSEELGLPEFDFEGSMIASVEQFFRKFGGILTPTYTLSWKRRSTGLHQRVARKMVRLVAGEP